MIITVSHHLEDPSDMSKEIRIRFQTLTTDKKIQSSAYYIISPENGRELIEAIKKALESMEQKS